MSDGKTPNTRVAFLAGLLAGLVIMFVGGKLFGAGTPEPAQLAPQPFAAAEPATDTFVDQALASDQTRDQAAN